MKIKKGVFLRIAITVLLLAAVAYPSYAKTTPEGYTVLGRGNTCAYYIDNDADGYGVGKRSDGFYNVRGLMGDRPDADDNDPAINTPATVLQHYDANSNGKLDNAELKLFLLEHKGYNVKNIYYYALYGSNATGEVNNPDKPFGYADYGGRPWDDWDAFSRRVQPGDAVVFREGRIKGGFSVGFGNWGGTEEDPIFVLAYPAEKAIIDFVASIYSNDISHIVFDGLILDSTVYPGEGKAVDGHNWTDVVLRNLEGTNHGTGIGPGGDNLLIENNVIHDNTAEHGIYLGANASTGPRTNVIVRGNVVYRNHRHGIQWNGPVTNLLIENNIFHSNDMGGIQLLNGASHSIARNNLIFNNKKQGIIFFNDNDNFPRRPYDQVHNLIEGNTIWVGRYNWDGSGTSVSDHAAIVFSNVAAGRVGDLDYNIIRNNILVTDNGPVIKFYEADYADTTTIENNIFYRASGNNLVLYYCSECSEAKKEPYSMAGFNAFSPLFKNNIFAEPQFKDVSIGYYAQPERFDFNLVSASPAIDFGTATDKLPYDLLMNQRPYDGSGDGAAQYDAGCYEYGASPIGFTILTPSLAAAGVGNYYSNTLLAENGHFPYTWSLIQGSLPQGISLKSNGIISGTPIESGTFTFTVRVEDSSMQAATKELSLEVLTTYLVSASVETGMGSIEQSGSLLVPEGSDWWFRILPAQGYRLADLRVDGVSRLADIRIDSASQPTYLFENIQSSHTIQAYFVQSSKYFLSVDSLHGSVTKAPDKAGYDLGEAVTISATADAGYQFSHWSGDATGTNSATSITIDSDKFVTAHFVSTVPPAILYGDVSGNGEISAADASLAAQYAVGLITLTPEQITKADVSGNGEVSAADASLIAQRAVGLINKFPVEGG